MSLSSGKGKISTKPVDRKQGTFPINEALQMRSTLEYDRWSFGSKKVDHLPYLRPNSSSSFTQPTVRNWLGKSSSISGSSCRPTIHRISRTCASRPISYYPWRSARTLREASRYRSRCASSNSSATTRTRSTNLQHRSSPQLVAWKAPIRLSAWSAHLYWSKHGRTTIATTVSSTSRSLCWRVSSRR